MSAHTLRGVLPVLQTPFRGDGALDEQALRREIDWVFDCGASGITVAMVSEVLRLDAAERRELSTLACDGARGRGPVVVSVGAESTYIAVGLARHAQSVGASAVMAIPPLSVAVAGEELWQYYEDILAATELPVIVQDASSYVGSAIPIELMARMHERHGQRIQFKPEAAPLGPRLSELLVATRGRAEVYDGSGGVALIETFRRGVIGSMPAADVCWAIVRLWNALQQGDFASAYRISLPLTALLALQTGLDGYVAIEKYLLVKQKIFENSKRRGPVAFALDHVITAEVDVLFDLLTTACAPMPGNVADPDHSEKGSAER